jgi:hypothetical protein
MVPSDETQAATLSPTFALTASLCPGRTRQRQQKSALQLGVEAARRPSRSRQSGHSKSHERPCTTVGSGDGPQDAWSGCPETTAS